MCGLFGAINTTGGQIDAARITALALLNEARGDQSTGLAYGSGGRAPTVYRQATSAFKVVQRKDWRRAVLDARAASWMIGHTRHATRGPIIERTAHPFTYTGKRGLIVGAHNGVVAAPDTYEVDSQYLFARLAKHAPQKALGKVAGSWALAYYQRGALHLHRQGNPLYLAKVGNVFYYSSQKDHLQAACPDATELASLPELAFWCFEKGGNWHSLPELIHKAAPYAWDWRTAAAARIPKVATTSATTATGAALGPKVASTTAAASGSAYVPAAYRIANAAADSKRQRKAAAHQAAERQAAGATSAEDARNDRSRQAAYRDSWAVAFPDDAATERAAWMHLDQDRY